MEQYQIVTRSRHLRYMYFVDSSYSYDDLYTLIKFNLRMWGGRYNPIIPVKEGIIGEDYLEIIKHYDPDFIFYSKGIDPETIRGLRMFNPKGYHIIDDPTGEQIRGVNALYLLPLFDAKSKVLMPSGLHGLDSPLLPFYRLNFGLTENGYVGDYAISKSYNQIHIKKDNFGTLNKIIHEEKPVNTAALSKVNFNTKILRSFAHAQYDETEIVIAADKVSTADLLYFWNRQLYQCHQVLYITVEELSLLSQDKFFGGVLYDLSLQSHIHVVSLSLEKEAVEKIIAEQLNKVAFNRYFQYKNVKPFPFPVLDAAGNFERGYGEQTSVQAFTASTGLFYFPDLSFSKKLNFDQQRWALDLQIKQIDGGASQPFLLPLTTDAHFFMKYVSGRVNRERNLTFFIENRDNRVVAELTIPPFIDLSRQLLSAPIVHGENIETKYKYTGFHDSSHRLQAFVHCFGGDWDTIGTYLRDKYWMDTFEQLCTSEKAAGDCITLAELVASCSEVLNKAGHPLGKREETRHNKENLILGIKEQLRQLCEYNVFLPGFKLKCTHCSSKYWYSMSEANRHVHCKGCLADFTFPIEPEFAYKLNDVIKNNIYQSKTQRDGNLTVIRTLLKLRQRGRNGFAYVPQINLFDKYHSTKPCNELDIMAIVDGHLVIGEAKHNSKDFKENNNKALNALIEVSKAILPDKVLLTCYEDDYSKLHNAAEYLRHHFKNFPYAPEVESFVIQSPAYFDLIGARYFYY